jgi:glycolate oxidase iron-sulfur subunit
MFDFLNKPHHASAANPAAGIDYELFLDCVHCGLCTAACPTYTEVADENDGPRGRIYLMRLVADGKLPVGHRLQEHLELCLDCRACETACPSGVHYGRLIEPFRLTMQEADQSLARRFDWFREIILFRIFPYAQRMRLLLTPVRVLQKLGLYQMAERLGLFKLIPGRMGHMATLLPTLTQGGPALPKFLPALGRRRARVAFFVGCVADAIFRDIHWATLRVLQQNGCDVIIPDGQACCGAIHYHAGSRDGARALADQNVAAFDLADIDAVVVNHGGCGAMLKEYGLHWRDAMQPRRQAFSAKVYDVHEFLDKLGPVAPTGRIEALATYHDSCHLAHAQKCFDPPRKLMGLIPGLKMVNLPEAEICCGSAGTYNLNQPEMADRLSKRKLENIRRTGAEVVVAANAGCLLQIGRELRQARMPVRLLHPMELLDLSYREQGLDGQGGR